MPNLVNYSHQKQDIAVLTVENPPVNALSPGVPEGIADWALRAANADAARCEGLY